MKCEDKSNKRTRKIIVVSIAAFILLLGAIALLLYEDARSSREALAYRSLAEIEQALGKPYAVAKGSLIHFGHGNVTQEELDAGVYVQVYMLRSFNPKFLVVKIDVNDKVIDSWFEYS